MGQKPSSIMNNMSGDLLNSPAPNVATNNRGLDKFIQLDGYTYKHYQTEDTGVRYYKCVNEKTHGCKGSANIKPGQKAVPFKLHTCGGKAGRRSPGRFLPYNRNQAPAAVGTTSQSRDSITSQAAQTTTDSSRPGPSQEEEQMVSDEDVEDNEYLDDTYKKLQIKYLTDKIRWENVVGELTKKKLELEIQNLDQRSSPCGSQPRKRVALPRQNQI